MATSMLIAPDAQGYTPNGWVNPYPHSDLNGPCAGQCCEPDAYPQPLTWSCTANPACPAWLREPGECINCSPAPSTTTPA